MASFSQLGQIVYGSSAPLSTEFQQRVNYAMSVAAVAVYSESTGTTGHAIRAAFATRVLNGNFNLVAACFAVLTNPTIAAEAVPGQSGNNIPDADIQFAINSIWNALAGA